MIHTDQQLRAASHRLGVDVEDMKALFHNRMPLTISPSKKHSPLSFSQPPLAFQSTAINTALDNSLLPICEKAFGNPLSQHTSISPGTSSPASSASQDYPRNPESNSAASISSSAAALLQSASKPVSHDLSLSSDHADRSEPHSEPHSERITPRTRSTSRRLNNHVSAAASPTSKRVTRSETEKRCSPKNNSSVPSLSGSPPKSPRLTPSESILSFARGITSSLADVSGLKEENGTALVRSLAIIPGCNVYCNCCVFEYIHVLLSSHLTMLDTLTEDRNAEDKTKVTDRKFEITETSWKEHIRAHKPSTIKDSPVSHPPMIRKTVDLLQFVYRLVNKVSNFQDTLTGAFLEGLYTTGVPTLVASLTAKLLQRPLSAPLNESDVEEHGYLYDWCVRLFKDFIVYEVSPVSRVRHMKNLPVDKFAVFGFGKGEMPSLSTVIHDCFQAVSSHQTTKEGRNAVSELVQAFLVWSQPRNSDGGPDSFRETIGGATEPQCLDLLVGKEAFWSMVVQPALHQVNKEPQLSDSIFEYTFLSSLLSISAAKRALFDSKNDKCKQMLLNLMIRLFTLLSRDILSSFHSAEEMRRLHPDVYTSIDFVHGLMLSAAIQREILGSEAATRGLFLSSLESLITNAAKLIRNPLDADESQRYAQKGPFAKVMLKSVDSVQADSGHESSRMSQKQEISKKIIDHDAIAREKAIAFAAKVVGCAGKSVENGSWDMSQMNSMRALFETRIISSRSRHRLWNDVYGIWRAVQKKIGHHMLLSTSERNSFAMVVEVVRKHASYDSMDRTDGSTSRDSTAELKTCGVVSRSTEVETKFPPIWESREARRAVCGPKGYKDFDLDPHNLMLLKDALIAKGQQMLARYDPDSEFTVKWIRLQKKNAYVGRARDLLESADKTVGLKCSCVPGYFKKGGNESETRIACSSDLCENRHMKIECVPGTCGAQSYCMNQRMQRMDYARFKMSSFPGKGIGILADEDISEGALVGEYQGEVVTMNEYEKRVREYEGERHFYFMTLTSKLVIDASRRSQATRFLNHSCDPNSETQKWNAEGEPRVGIFARRAIKKGEEITFDYGARSLTRYSAKCLCGAQNCRGLLALRQENKDCAKPLDPEGFMRSGEIRKMVTGAPSNRAEEADGLAAEEDRRSSIIKAKIEIANRYLRDAEELERKVQEHHSPSREPVLAADAIEKLEAWKLSLSARSIPLFSLNPSKDIREEVAIPRIPRKGAVPAPFDKQLAEKSRVETSRVKASSLRNSTSCAADPPSAPQRGSLHTLKRRGPSASRWALFEETVSAKTAPVQAPVKRNLDVDGTRRFSKLPKADFLPTTSKLKRDQPIRPKVAKRRRTRKHEEGDSFDEYSTASEAEPILEDPIMSPTRLPDGSGACSDDEFIAAPPVESIQYSPYGKRWNHSEKGHRMFEGRQGDHHDYSVAVMARDGQRSRLVPKKAVPRLGLVGNRTPKGSRRSDRVREDFEDRNSRLPHHLGTSGPRRPREYRFEWSPSMQNHTRSHPQSLGKKIGEERGGMNENDYQRQSNVLPTFSPDVRENNNARLRKDPKHNRTSNVGRGASICQPVRSLRSEPNNENNLSDTGVRDTNRSKPMYQSRVDVEPRSHLHVERENPIRSYEGERRSRDGHETSHLSWFPRDVMPQNFNTVNDQRVMDWSQPHGKEMDDAKSRTAKNGPKEDLRNIIGSRSRSKNY